MLPPATFELGGSLFAVPPLLGEESFLLQPKILPLVADLTGLFVARREAGTMEDLLAVAGPLVAKAARALPAEDLKYIMRTLLKGATVDGKALYSAEGNPLQINVMMQGRTIDIWRLIIKALEVSYPDFFALLRGLRGSSAGEGSEQSSTSSRGPAGDSSPVDGVG